MTDIISAIDAATGCQQCGNPLGASPSSDFCGEFCQATWHEKRVGVEREKPKPSVTIEVSAVVEALGRQSSAAARAARGLARLIHGNPAIDEALRRQHTPPVAEGL